MTSSKFQLGLTGDFLNPEGKLTYRDIGLDILDAEPRLEYRFLPKHGTTMTAEDLRGLDAVISLAPRYTRESFAGLDRLVAILRFGVGYDMVDVQACTDHDVLLCITPGAVNYSMAESTVAWMLALAHRVFLKDRLVREGRWGEKVNYMGCELREKTLGLVGCGGIGGKLVELVGTFGMNPPLAFDPYLDSERAKSLGVTPVPLVRLLCESDFVSINCPLTAETRGLIGANELALMKPGAFVINTARGGIVDEAALVEALRANRIAGAATDVFDAEPAGADHPLAKLDNVILAPHAIGWTHEMFREIGRAACRAAVALSRGEIPEGVINREVVETAAFGAKMSGLSGRR